MSCKIITQFIHKHIKCNSHISNNVILRYMSLLNNNIFFSIWNLVIFGLNNEFKTMK